MGLTLEIVQNDDITLVVNDTPTVLAVEQIAAPVLAINAPDNTFVVEVMAGLKGDKGDPGVGGGGSGTVQSVNNVSPDVGGTSLLTRQTLARLQMTMFQTGQMLLAKPSTFTPSTHTHSESDITGLTGELAAKAPLDSPTFTGTVSGISKSAVGLGNVDNTADSAKPVSSAQQTALDAKAPIASPTFTGTSPVSPSLWSVLAMLITQQTQRSRYPLLSRQR